MARRKRGHSHLGGVPGETGLQPPPDDWSDAYCGKSTYAEGAQNDPEPRAYGGYNARTVSEKRTTQRR